jgi:hypothetical protein
MAAYESQTYDEICPEGDGGDRNLVNQDECLILDATTQRLSTRAEGMQEPGRH